jgi:hypothetical protein
MDRNNPYRGTAEAHLVGVADLRHAKRRVVSLVAVVAEGVRVDHHHERVPVDQHRYHACDDDVLSYCGSSAAGHEAPIKRCGLSIPSIERVQYFIISRIQGVLVGRKMTPATQIK